MNPNNVMLVAKHKGREIGRIAATAKNANAFLSELTQHYDSVEIEYVEDKDAAMISRILSPRS